MDIERDPKNNNYFNIYSILLAISIPFVLYIGYRILLSNRRLIPISSIALILGILYENKRLSKNRNTVFIAFTGSLAFSFVAFFPGKKERNYDFESHIEAWPYAFIISFIIATIAFNKDKIIPKLTEGTTLLISIAAIYWMVDYGFVNTQNIFMLFIISIGLLFSLFSIFHAFTKIELTKRNKLILSFWSCIIFILFAIDNILRVIKNDSIENVSDITIQLYIGLQYFLLGVSGVYIVQNLSMILGFLPKKNAFFNQKYRDELKELKEEHINRFSSEQVRKLHSLYCIIFTSAIFTLNYYYKIVPRHLAIWIVFVLFPILLFFYNRFSNKINSL